MPVLTFPRGLHTGVGSASPAHVHDAKNVYHDGSNLVGRGGTEILDAVDGWSTCATGAFGFVADKPAIDAATLPAAMTTVGSGTIGSGVNQYVVVGSEIQFNRFQLYGEFLTLADDAHAFDDYPVCRYWNGTAWSPLTVARTWKPNYQIVGGADTCSIRPFFAGAIDGSAPGELFSCAFVPPSDWTAVAVGGVDYNLIAVCMKSRDQDATAAALVASVTIDTNQSGAVDGATVSTSDTRVLCVYPYTDRAGAGHLFAACLSYGQTRFYVDGAPKYFYADDGGVLVRAFPADVNTDVWATYHTATDTLFVRLGNDRWLKYDAGSVTSGYFNEVAATGTGTIYESLDQGLRTSIPTGTVNAQFEGRIWEASDGWVRWSASDVYPDVWPNEFERYVYDNVTCMVPTKTWMAIFSRGACYRAINDGSADGYIIEKMLGGTGCVGPRAACAVGDVVFFLAADGVYRMTGDGSVAKMTAAINDWFTADRSGNMARAVMLYHGGLDQVRLFYPSGVESNVLDEALYADARGYEYTEHGVQLTGMAWWPQGRKLVTDYGFNASALAMDERTTTPVMIVGDQYGLIWEHDVGDCDNGPPVFRSLLSAPINADSSRNVIVRWVNPTFENTGDVELDVIVKPDLNDQHQRTVSISAYPGSATNERIANDTQTCSDTFYARGEDTSLVREVSFAQRCRCIQVGFEQEQFLPLRLTGVELRVNAQGAIGGR